MNKEIPFKTKDGHEYLIVFTEFQHTPRNYGIKIIDVSIVLMNDVYTINRVDTLFNFSHIIFNYLRENDVILYYYCDVTPIKIRYNRKRKLTPQAYRSKLFSKMFEKFNTNEYIQRPIKINDHENGHHYVCLVCHQSNNNALKEVEKDLISAGK